MIIFLITYSLYNSNTNSCDSKVCKVLIPTVGFAASLTLLAFEKELLNLFTILYFHIEVICSSLLTFCLWLYAIYTIRVSKQNQVEGESFDTIFNNVQCDICSKNLTTDIHCKLDYKTCEGGHNFCSFCHKNILNSSNICVLCKGILVNKSQVVGSRKIVDA